MIIDLHEKYYVSPEWFEEQVKTALSVADAAIVEKLSLPRLCVLLSAYKVKDEVAGKEAAAKMKALVNSPLIDEAMTGRTGRKRIRKTLPKTKQG